MKVRGFARSWWLLALLPLLPALQIGFLLDDWIGLEQLLQRGWEEVANQFWSAGGPFFRPLGWGFFQLELAVFGIRASAFHAIHLALFALAAWLTGRLTAQIARSPDDRSVQRGRLVAWPAALALLYPGRIETFAWVAAGFDLLALLLGLTVLLLHLHCRRRPATISALGLVALAYMSTLAKESAYAFLAVIVVWEVLPDLLAPAPQRGRLLAGAAAAGGFLAGGLHRLATVGGVGGYQGTGLEAVTDHLPGLPEAILLAAFAPVHPGYGAWSATFELLCALAFSGVLVAGLVAARRRAAVRRILLAGTALALLGLLPVLPYLNPTAHWSQSRFLTLFGAGLAMVAAAPVGQRNPTPSRRWRAVPAILLLAWGGATVVNLLPWIEAARAREVVLETVGRDTADPGPHRVWIEGPINRWKGAHLLGGALDAALHVTYPERQIEADSAFFQRYQGRTVRPPSPKPGVKLHLYDCAPRQGRMDCEAPAPPVPRGER